MDIIDYQQECALIRYPFKDNATLVWTNSSSTGVLPNNIVLDAVITIQETSFIQPVFQSITFDGTTCIFSFSNSLAISTIYIPGINTLASRSSSGNDLIRLDMDIDQLFTYLISTGLTGTFTFADSYLCASCYKFLPPRITGLTIKNLEQPIWNDSPTTPIIIDSTTGGITLQEGTNAKFTLNNIVGPAIDILPGSGEGLYNGCPELNNDILTINNTGPNSNGNFFFGNDNCFEIKTAQNSLGMSNDCLARCTPADIINLAHYTNRITDASIQLSDYMTTVQSAYTSMLDTYNNSGITVSSPYIIVQLNNQSNKVNNYLNLTCGIYNPNKSSIQTTLSSNYGNDYNVVPGSAYLTEKNIKTTLPDPVTNGGSATLFSAKTLDCSSVNYAGMVIFAPVTVVNLGDSSNDIVFNLSTISDNVTTLVSTYTVSMAPQSFNFSISNQVSFSSSMKFVTLALDLNDPTKVTNSATTINITAPGVFSLVSSQLVANGITTNLSTAGLSNIALDYTKSNQYIITLSCNNTVTGSLSIEIAAYNTSGSSNKSSTFTL